MYNVQRREGKGIKFMKYANNNVFLPLKFVYIRKM